MIVGGGPGGMVAALTAARRGHQVTLCEKERTLGGELIPGGKPAFKSEIGRLLDYWKGELADSDVEVKLNVKVTPDLVRDERPDALVVAVGADPIIPSIPGIESPNVMTAIEAFKSNELTGKTVAVVGGGDVGCECALHLTQQGCRVTIVEMMEQLLLLEDVHSIRVDLLRMIEHAGIAVLTSTKVVGIERDRVLIKTGAEVPHSLETEMVVMAVGMQSHSQTAHKLAGECADVRIVGDCLKPRRIRDAVVEGDLAGRLV
jgi:2-enoate reductase